MVHALVCASFPEINMIVSCHSATNCLFLHPRYSTANSLAPDPKTGPEVPYSNEAKEVNVMTNDRAKVIHQIHVASIEPSIWRTCNAKVVHTSHGIFKQFQCGLAFALPNGISQWTKQRREDFRKFFRTAWTSVVRISLLETVLPHSHLVFLGFFSKLI